MTCQVSSTLIEMLLNYFLKEKEMKFVLGPMRIPFLILTPACVLLGYGTAAWTTGHLDVLYCILALVGAVSAHISVNAFNEYYDFKSGLDFKTERTPFSGGSGTLPEKPELAKSALITSWITFAITAAVGIFFLYVRGLALLPLGLLGLIIIYTYTVWLTRIPLLCLIAPGLGFGLLMVMGTDFVLTGSYSWTAFVASLIPFFLVSNLLLLNQFPDVNADQSVGRKHIPIVLGKKTGAIIYGIFLLLAYLSVATGVLLGYLPPFSLLGLIPVILAIPTFIGVIRYAENIEKLLKFMQLNVILIIMTPVLVAIGLFIS